MEFSTQNASSHQEFSSSNSNEVGIISSGTVYVIEIFFSILISGIFGLLGVIANSINAAVFFKQGLHESSNISLFCLSLSDWCISLLLMFASVTFALGKAYPGGSVDYFSVYLLGAGNPMTFFSKISMITTMFLCFERCLCVVQPWRVKAIITRLRSIVILSFLYFVVTFFDIFYMVVDKRLAWTFDNRFNKTRLRIIQIGHHLHALMIKVNHSVNGTGTTIFCAGIMLVSTFVMIWGIYGATKKRKELVTVGVTTDAAQSSKSASGANRGLSKKDVRLVQIVLYIAFLFLISNMPILGIEFVNVFVESGLDWYGKYRNLNQMLWSIVRACLALNVTGNIIIYSFLSERYRTVLQSMMKKK